MEDDHKQFSEIIRNIAQTKVSLTALSQLVESFDYGQDVLSELYLISTSFKEALRRLRENTSNPEPQKVSELHLTVKQLRMMAEDLVGVCKNKMVATS